jgi:hypothetical protein
MARIACTVLLMLMSASAAAGQLSSLGDAAKKADDSRKAAPPRSFTEQDLVAIEWIITSEGLEEYAAARTEMAAVRRKNTALHQRLFEASRRAKTLADLARALGTDTSIMQLLSRNRLTTREYLRREQALINATAWAAQKRLPDSLKNRPIRIQNVEFVRANDKLMRDMAARYKAEPSPVWFNPARFVEQP